MTSDDAFPLTAFMAPPKDDEEAAQRVAELTSLGYLTGLVGAVFHDDLQLHRALRECGYNMSPGKVLMDSGRVKTLRCKVIDKAGNEYEVLLNAIGDHWLQVVNARLAAAGAGDPRKEALDKATKDQG